MTDNATEPNDPDSPRMAYHEAGHAVVAWAVGLTIVRVEISSRGGKSEQVPTADELAAQSDDKVDAFERWACVHLAGGRAQARWNPDVGVAGCDDDHHAFNECVWTVSPLTAETDAQCGRRLAERTEALIGQHWSRIEALALALLDQESLSGSEATMTIEAGELIE